MKRQLLDEEVELLARTSSIELPEDRQRWTVLGFVYDDPAVAQGYVRANRAHGHFAEQVMTPGREPASILIAGCPAWYDSVGSAQ